MLVGVCRLLLFSDDAYVSFIDELIYCFDVMAIFGLLLCDVDNSEYSGVEG